MYIAIAAAALLLIAWLAAGYRFYRMSLSRRVGDDYRRERFNPKTDDDRALLEWEKNLPAPPRPVSLNAGKITLAGVEYAAPRPDGRWVIAIHGHGLSKEFMRYAAFMFYEKNMNTLCIDLRAHGDSGGAATDMGLTDGADVALWANDLCKRYPGCEIALFGISLGAATAVFASGENLPPCVKSIVADSPFSDAPKLFEYMCRHLFRLPPRLIMPSYKISARLSAGIELSEISPLNRLKKGGELPILFIHGEDDTFIPPAMSEELCEAAGERAQLYKIPGAKHACGVLVDPNYKTIVTDYIAERFETSGKLPVS